MRVLLLFVDGVGLGARDPETNPLVAANMPALGSLLNGQPLTGEAVPFAAPGIRAVPTDPRLGVPGLPQSATGQTAIFTGCNAAQAIGRHLSAYPTPSLKALLQEHSIFRKVEALGLTATFLNAFGPQLFAWVAEGQPQLLDRRRRPSASLVAALAAGVHALRSVEQLRSGDAVGFDIDHVLMRERGYDVELADPTEAGRRAARIAARHHFALYEYFLTDKAGHGQEMAGAVQVLQRLDAFLAGVLEAMPADLTLVITSDHGNVEDLSVRTHTLGDVPTIVKGPGAEFMAPRIHSLTDITPVIITWLEQSMP